MKQEPKLSEFEAMIVHFEEVEEAINMEPEHYDVGPIALFTGNRFPYRKIFFESINITMSDQLHYLQVILFLQKNIFLTYLICFLKFFAF